jgi:hypothetical protein
MVSTAHALSNVQLPQSEIIDAAIVSAFLDVLADVPSSVDADRAFRNSRSRVEVLLSASGIDPWVISEARRQLACDPGLLPPA